MNQEYSDFNQRLSMGLGIDNGFSYPARTTAAKTDNTGTLVVSVTLARGSIPLENATVIISRAGETEEQLQTLTTDQSGRTAGISLPAQPLSLSQSPESAPESPSLYNIQVTLPGFYPELRINVPVFEGITSVQPIAMIPLAEGDVSSGQLIVDEERRG